jgi:hypothetical protein
LDESAIDPPASLVKALRVYFLGLAATYLEKGRGSPRSMLVHPSQGRDPHDSFYTWVDQYLESTKDQVALSRTDPAAMEDLLEEFRAAWIDISATSQNLPELSELVKVLPTVLRHTLVLKMNAATGATPTVPWKDFFGFILVGGQALDRGFTVQGLTVTYMPRGVGVGNADTVQQRARFFGYKRDYLGLCRVYVESSTRSAFEAYVKHEEDVREKLREVSERGIDVRAWRRLFVLDPALQPTRWAVRDRGAARGGGGEEWLWLRHPISELSSSVTLPDSVASALDWQLDSDAPFVSFPSIDLSDAANFLADVDPVDELDSLQLTGMISQLEAASRFASSEVVDVLLMRPGRKSVRAVDSRGVIRQLFQGRTSRGRSGQGYLGDRSIHDDRFTLQIHNVELRSSGPEVVSGIVPALFVPERLASPWFLQETS